MSDLIIRKANLDEWHSIKALRRQTLETDENNFGATLEEFLQQPEDKFKQRLINLYEQGGFIVAAYDNNKPVAMLGMEKDNRKKTKHKMMLWGMYVEPAYRKQKLGLKLISAAINFAKEDSDIKVINLYVRSDNKQAFKLYESLGFKVYGTEPRGLMLNGEYISEHFLSLFL